MCEPISLLTLALGAGSALMGMSQKTPDPPKAVLPAPAPVNAEPSAVIKVGPTDRDPSRTPGMTDVPFTETRSAGSPFGNLGRSTLAL